MHRDRNDSGGMFEQLEDRRLCSATLLNGVVRVEGSNYREEVTVSSYVSNSELSMGVRFLRVKEVSYQPFFTVTRTSDFVAGQVSRLRVNSLGGNDVINLLQSPVGADVYAGGGHDQVMGSFTNDNIYGDLVFSAEFGGQLVGTPGNDILDGNAGNDIIYGGPADDRISGGYGFDAMFGESGNDSLYARDGVANEIVDGGTGFDYAQVDEELWGAPKDRLFSIDSIII
jgi:Ca2+-binding RTX toxin-like protein